MLHHNLKVGIYSSDEVEDHSDVAEVSFEDTRVVYDSDQFGSFFPDSDESFSGRASENGRYLACWREREVTRREETYPTGACLAENGTIVRTTELADIKVMTPANDGTVAGLIRAGENDQLLVLDQDGTKLLDDTFESNTSAIAIAPDGDHVAVSTAFLDNAVHLYRTQDGQYLGRTENRSTSVLGDLRFGTHEGTPAVETYDVAPDSDLDVHENRNQVIDRIPLEPQIDAQSLNGVCIVGAEADEKFHFVPNSELTDVQGTLRTPGVQVDAACERSFEPIDVSIIFQEPRKAIESQFEFCSECRSAAAVYPDSKT